MLPLPIYRTLPYLYIGSGVLCVLLFESDIIFIPALLLVSAGVSVLWMRNKAASGFLFPRSKRKVELDEDLDESILDRRERDRRVPMGEQAFPIIDDNGSSIAFDRRVGERRKQEED